MRAPSRRLPIPDVTANKLPRNVGKQEQTFLRVTQFQGAQFETNKILKLKNKELLIFLKDAEFYLAGSRSNETKVKKEYCWAITEAAGRSCCGVSSSSALEFGFKLDSLIQIPQLTKRILSFQLAPYLPQISHKSRSAYSTDTMSYPRRTKSMVAWNIFRQRACASVIGDRFGQRPWFRCKNCR